MEPMTLQGMRARVEGAHAGAGIGWYGQRFDNSRRALIRFGGFGPGAVGCGVDWCDAQAGWASSHDLLHP
jgi:hypothetical protein